MIRGLQKEQSEMRQQLNQPSTLVYGLGMSGLSVARFLKEKGLVFALADTREIPPKAAVLNTEFSACAKYFGRLDEIPIEQYDELVVSPGLALNEPLIRRAVDANVSVLGDIELFYRHAEAPIIAITGSNGKSSVVTLVTEILQKAGLLAYYGGNIGVPALDLLSQPVPDYYVLEVSSFQLETVQRFAPKIAALLNISPDHMDRYAKFKDYVAAKMKLFPRAESAVFNRANASLAESFAADALLLFGGDSPDTADYKLAGEASNKFLVTTKNRKIPIKDIFLNNAHNLENALAALAITDLAGVPLDAQARALNDFRGLEHRTEHVGVWQDVTWINDSKGTNVGATLAAIAGVLEYSPGILIAGGVGKGADFSVLKEAVGKHVKACVLYGRDAKLIADAIGDCRPAHVVDDLAGAIATAKQLASAGDTVLFSPACASFDMFENYQQRGEVFKRLVREVHAA